MNLNQYIKRNYKNPNVQVLKALGASDNLISYLTHTPWNTNSEVAKAIAGADGGDNNWTVIRLDYDVITEPNPSLITTKAEDISNFLELYDMYINDQHPIIILNSITFGKERKNIPMNCMAGEYQGEEGKFLIGMFGWLPINFLQSSSMLKFYLNNSQDALENDYIEIKYKTGNYYTVTIPDINEDVYAVEQNSSWNLDTFFADMGAPGYGFTDGTNSYFDGDTIVFNKNTTLNLVVPN